MSDMVTSGAYPLRRTPTQDRASRQVERILDAACAEVVERGYDAASTSGIAKRAEIAVGSVYRYFPDKRSLIQAIERRNQARYTEAVRERLAAVSSWREAVDVTLDTFREMHRTDPGFRAVVLSGLGDPDLETQPGEFDDQHAGEFAELLAALRRPRQPRVPAGGHAEHRDGRGPGASGRPLARGRRTTSCLRAGRCCTDLLAPHLLLERQVRAGEQNQKTPATGARDCGSLRCRPRAALRLWNRVRGLSGPRPELGPVADPAGDPGPAGRPDVVADDHPVVLGVVIRLPTGNLRETSNGPSPRRV